MTAVRSLPCSVCPYRRDCPQGVWGSEEYDKLRPYDAETWGQPTAGFRCHATPDHYCHGWAVVHMSRGHEFELLALRIRWPDGGIPTAGAVSLFGSGGEAAEHGQTAPSAAAIAAMQRLVRKYPHIAGEMDDASDQP